MKTYKLATWPDLPAAFLHVNYTRVLTELSQCHATEDSLLRATGLAAPELRVFLSYLNSQGLLDVQDRPATASPRFTLGFASWLRRA